MDSLSVNVKNERSNLISTLSDVRLASARHGAARVNRRAVQRSWSAVVHVANLSSVQQAQGGGQHSLDLFEFVAELVLEK